MGADDVKGIKFSQKGYLVNVISSHDVDASIKGPDDSLVHFKIKVAIVKWNNDSFLIAQMPTFNSFFLL